MTSSARAFARVTDHGQELGCRRQQRQRDPGAEDGKNAPGGGSRPYGRVAAVGGHRQVCKVEVAVAQRDPHRDAVSGEPGLCRDRGECVEAGADGQFGDQRAVSCLAGRRGLAEQGNEPAAGRQRVLRASAHCQHKAAAGRCRAGSENPDVDFGSPRGRSLVTVRQPVHGRLVQDDLRRALG
jgi:hypothetical protein